MGRQILGMTCFLLLLTGSLSAASDYNGYLSVNDEDYGYWEARVIIFPGGERVVLDEYTQSITGTLVFELGHDLARGLVRQFTPREEAEATGSISVSDEAVASGKREVAPPRGKGQWVFLSDFGAFGFGQYEGQLTTAHVYCTDRPKVWAWLAGPRVEGSSPDDVADLLIQTENGMARLKLGCARPLTVEHE